MRRLFASDLHLRPERPDLTGAFLHFLRETASGADELYLLGDIFEAWIGDDAPMPGLDDVYGALAHLSASGTRLYFQHGNRDFLVGEALMARIGGELLPEAFCIEHPAGPILLMHGDQLCTDDAEYLAFRNQVRDANWQRQFLAQSVEQRMAIARQLREASKARGMEKSDEIMDVNPQAVREAMLDAGVEQLIHGHTHRPAVHRNQLGDGSGIRIVLGDWDRRGWYLELDDSGFELIDFPIE
ncbi:MAG: UDP-2,3-diacylglucosamine diphosphatase [Oceanospirillaceae bacterium]|nr:UDP-2,3-diacylglucosamine diphosphatase [Oceanospirillaceae bacterium]